MRDKVFFSEKMFISLAQKSWLDDMSKKLSISFDSTVYQCFNFANANQTQFMNLIKTVNLKEVRKLRLYKSKIRFNYYTAAEIEKLKEYKASTSSQSYKITKVLLLELIVMHARICSVDFISFVNAKKEELS